MKKHALLLLTICGATALHCPAQDVPPAPPIPPVPPVSAAPPKRRQPATFLGIEVRSLPNALSDQLNLPEGFGVLVDYVVPGSAADAAGVKPNDVLKSVDGQIVTSAAHLAVLVHSYAEGQEVRLAVLHRGQENTLTAKLQQRARHSGDPDGSEAPGYDEPFTFEDGGLSPDYERQLRTSLERSRVQIDAATRRALAESRRALDEAREQTARAFASRLDFGRAQVVLRDPTGRIELRVARGKRKLRVRDDKGGTVFEGPINTPEQRKAIPANVLPQVEALEREQATAFPKDAEDDDDSR